MKQILTIICLFVIWSAAGQRTLTGVIQSATDGSTIEGVSIGIDGTNIGTTSNADGWFMLKIPESSLNDTLFVSHVAYKEITIAIPSLRNSAVYTLTPHSLIAEEVLVEGGRVRKESLDQRGNVQLKWSWIFCEEIAEFGSFFDVEEMFRVTGFRFKIMDHADTRIRAAIEIYLMVDGTPHNILSHPIYFWIEPSQEVQYDHDFDYTKRPSPLPFIEDGFIEMTDIEMLQNEYDETIDINPGFILEKGHFLVTMKFIMTPETLRIMRYPWAMPRIAAYSEPGMIRSANDPFHFLPSNRNAGIMVRGYGK